MKKQFKTNKMNMNETIKPTSLQFNADDLIGGTKTIKIREIKGNEDPAQPVSIFFDGDENKPYKPCKSMRRLLVSIWGGNGLEYIGRSLTLYRDNKVNFGGIAVGGIRISHASDITEAITVVLTASKTKRVPYKVEPIQLEELTPEHPFFEKIREAIKDGSRTIEQIQAKFNINNETLKLLQDEN